MHIVTVVVIIQVSWHIFVIKGRGPLLGHCSQLPTYI